MFLESLDTYDFDSDNYEEGIPAEPEVGYDIVFEATAEWHNIEMAMMKAEHAAIVTENRALMEEAKSGWWSKIVGFFKNLWARVKQFFTTMISGLLNITGIHVKWLDKNERRLKELDDSEISYKMFDYGKWLNDAPKNFTETMKKVQAEAEHVSSEDEISVDDFKRLVLRLVGGKDTETDAFVAELYKAFRGGKEKKEYKLSEVGGIPVLVKVLRASSTVIAGVKAGGSIISDMIKKGVAVAQQAEKDGLIDAGRDMGVSSREKTAMVKSMKNGVSVAQTTAVSFLALIREIQIVVFMALRYALSKGKSRADRDSGSPVRGSGSPSMAMTRTDSFTGNILDSFI